MSIMRDHYEGSPLDLTDNYKTGNPHFTAERTLCVTRTQYSVVTQLRSWLPAEIGGVYWLALANPDIRVFRPWYSGITGNPPPFRSGIMPEGSCTGQELSHHSFQCACPQRLSDGPDDDQRPRDAMRGTAEPSNRKIELGRLGQRPGIERTRILDHGEERKKAGTPL